MQRFCIPLNCTPSDNLDWRVGCKSVVHDIQRSRTLTKPRPDTNIQSHLRELPLDKLEKLGEMMAELKSDEHDPKNV
jgi:hypothetical protein